MAQECKELDKNMERIRLDMQRFNTLLAANDNAKAALTSAVANLRQQASEDLKVTHAQVAHFAATEDARKMCAGENVIC